MNVKKMRDLIEDYDRLAEKVAFANKIKRKLIDSSEMWLNVWDEDVEDTLSFGDTQVDAEAFDIAMHAYLIAVKKKMHKLRRKVGSIK